MNPIRQSADAVRKSLTALTVTQKLLVGSTVVIVIMAMVLVAVLTSKPDLVEVAPGAAATDTAQVQQALDTAGISSKIIAGKVMVSVSDQSRARLVLSESGTLPSDKATYFETLIARNDWMNSRQVNERNYYIALQNELGRTMAGFRGVSKATIRLSVPEPNGLGHATRKPTASIALTSETGQALPQGVVDAAARFVSGSIAGLTIEQVQIVDVAAGKPRVVTTDEGATSGVAMEHAQRLEDQTRQKLEGLLSYIPGVAVAVTASVDVTRSTSEIQEFLPVKSGSLQLERKKDETSNNSVESSKGSEPGFAANQAADINQGTSSPGNKTETSKETTEFENHVGSKVEHIIDPKGQSTSVAISVNVPRGYVVKLLKDAAAASSAGAGGGGGGQPPAAPSEKDVADRFDKDVRPQIVATLVPHIRAMVAQANPKADPKSIQDFITVNLVPMDIPEVASGTQAAGVMGSLTSGSGGGGMLGLSAGLVDKVVLGVLALAAMGMMIAMVKKTGKKTENPTAEELVGLPPALETVGEVIGEAEETETAMAGIEVGEDEMQAQKILEQVGDLVDKNPDGASKLLGRWVQVED